jgi:hypothetical protein
MKKIFILFVLFFSAFSPAQEECSDFLQASPQALREIFEQQKQVFSPKQQKTWQEALDHLIEDLEQVNGKSSKKDQILKNEILASLEKLPLMLEAWKRLQTADKGGYFKEAYAGVWATLTAHSHEMLEAQGKDKDYPRLFAILKEINQFDPQKEKFSFYKIRRAIQGRFSMKEYVNCRL